MGIETEHGSEKIKEPMEQSPAIIKGEEVEVFRRGQYYYLKGSEEAFSSRYYAEQAYRNNLEQKARPKMEAELKKTKRAVDMGIVSKKKLEQVEKEQKEWLEKQ